MTESNLPPLALMPSALASNPKITKSDWRTAVALAARRNAKTGLCCPSLPTLSGDTGLPLRNQRRSLDHLEALGLIGIVPRYNEKGARISNQYNLRFLDLIVRQKPKQRKTELPKDWKPAEKQRLFCKAQGYDPDEVAEEFRDFFHADGIPMADWDAAWINYVFGRDRKAA